MMVYDDVLRKYRTLLDEKIQCKIMSLSPKNSLRDACEYALMNGGKRFRPAIVLMVADALNLGADVTEAAISVEFFHTASLIADDLPCMDNDEFRREKPSLHKMYNEAIALLVSYALIAAGYESIALNGAEIKKSDLTFKNQADTLVALALENAGKNTGLSGATGGQFLDIFPPDLTWPTLRNIIDKKTSSLFEIAFVFGWLFGGGDVEKLSLVKKCASSFGASLQIADDISDLEKDQVEGRAVNVASVFGLEVANKMFHKELALYHRLLHDLKINTQQLVALGDNLMHAFIAK